jgi:HD-GYP domain-containing protein (c-di-GMP phosphodiesterase class II)
LLRVDLNQIRPGMLLALPVLHPQTPRQVLLRPGYRLEAHTVRRLRELNVRYVYVRYPRLAFLARRLSVHVAQHQACMVAAVSEAFESVQQHTAARLPYDAYCRAVADLVRALAEEPDAALFMGDLLQGGDELLRHSAAVTHLAVLMGLRLGGYVVRQRPLIAPERAAEVTNLGVGTMLHDVGVVRLDPRVRLRYEQTGDETDPAWQQHPKLGYELVRGQLDPSAAAVVLHHHQRVDGSGYAGSQMPLLDGDRIHIFARIAAVADQFDRIRRPPNLVEQPTVWALHAMTHRGLARRFDVAALRALLAVVPAYPPGSIVRLSDGQWAAVIDHDPRHPCRPMVLPIEDPADLDCAEADGTQPRRADAAALDLAAEGHDIPPQLAAAAINLAEADRALHVAEISGRNVADMNFTLPAWLHDDRLLAA